MLTGINKKAAASLKARRPLTGNTMDLLKVLMDSAGGGSAAQLGSQFGLDSAATSKVLGAVVAGTGSGAAEQFALCRWSGQPDERPAER